MKKNLISVLILALVVVNLVVSAIMLITIYPQAQKSNELIAKIATAIDLELQSGEITSASTVAIEDIESYQINSGETMTINLKKGADGESHYALIAVTLSINTADDDYETKQPLLSTNDDAMKDIIIKTVQSYTYEEWSDDQATVQDEMQDTILEELQDMYDSDFIVAVSFASITVQ